MTEKIKIQFLGAAGTVTGSKTLISALGKNILIDCGMFQGLKKLRQLNWQSLPVDISSIDSVLLTHGHLDHCGYLPRLVKSGFHGKIISTEPSLELAKIILRDSAKIQEEDAKRANHEKFSRHKPALAFYDHNDVDNCLSLFSACEKSKFFELFPGIKARFNYVGHILGACFIELDIDGKRLVFSGDIGRNNDILLFPPQKPEKADYLFIESTYGDRLHPEKPEEKLLSLIKDTIDKKGTVIIPSFAVERTQAISYLICKFIRDGLLPDLPVYLDSPMGQNTTALFDKFPDWHKLSLHDSLMMNRKIESVRSLKKTFKLAASTDSKIIIAGSGMATGGRVLTYFEKNLERKSSTILTSGLTMKARKG